MNRIMLILITVIYMSMMCGCNMNNKIWYDTEVVCGIEAFKIGYTNIPEFDLIRLKSSNVTIVSPHGKYQIGDTVMFKFKR
jgi:hypothetical protein